MVFSRNIRPRHVELGSAIRYRFTDEREFPISKCFPFFYHLLFRFHFQKISSFPKNTQFIKYNVFFFLLFQILYSQSSTINTLILIHSSPHSNLFKSILLTFLLFYLFLHIITKNRLVFGLLKKRSYSHIHGLM